MAPSHPDTFGARTTLRVGARELTIFALDAPSLAPFGVARLPFCIKVLLENLLRHEDGAKVTAPQVEALARWGETMGAHGRGSEQELAFSPERVLMQDLTGVPAIVDLAGMRDAISTLGGAASAINPKVPVELVVDHSVIIEHSGNAAAFADNVDVEYERNLERYTLLKWAQNAFEHLRVVPPGTGICHQVNLEYLSRVVFERDGVAFPDTLVGIDSHTTMVNGLGVVGWGVGGIEAEAAVLGQPIPMLVPPVVGLRLVGATKEGVTATDVVLTITELLRHHGVVGKFVEAFGPGVAALSLETRATIGNMSPEYGSTCTVFPIDQVTLDYLAFTGRDDDRIELVEAYARRQGLWHDPTEPEPAFSEVAELDLSTVEPSLAGPSRPQDRVSLASVKDASRRAAGRELTSVGASGVTSTLRDGDVVIAAITSCTNTSNPSVMVAAGLLAERAVARGLHTKPWVKTSLAPGSRVVIDYLQRAGLLEPLDALGFYLAGYGCTTCIGNSGPLLEGVTEAVAAGGLSVAAVLSGNRNFESRIHPDVRQNYLASPPLVVAYALAGTVDVDLTTEPLGTDAEGRDVFLRDVWPSDTEVSAAVRASLSPSQFTERYAEVFNGDERWEALGAPGEETFGWEPASTYVLAPPFFDGIGPVPEPVHDVVGARVLVLLGDSVTTDHISPAGAIRPTVPAGRYLVEHGVAPKDFNTYGTRRGNHEVMVRGTFANLRIKNLLVPGTEGGVTKVFPSGEEMTVFDAAEAYRRTGTPLLVVAGAEYGTGSSRDWAAKGTLLLGVRAVLAVSYERIHRSNLIGMGVAPLQFQPGESLATWDLDGTERYDVVGLEALNDGSVPKSVTVRAHAADDTVTEFEAVVRIDTPTEADYYRHGGVLHYVLRSLAADAVG
ncbi:MAG TPA: aconitate hydratase AcnA [Acidimicrobiales bacterium]|jgi:aconitate hydratase|nr:aconitate hydratase AcnA [Acidimicrobiales bacterium]